MNRPRVVSLAWLALSLAACAAAAPRSGSTDPAERNIAALHARKCGACHTTPDPKTRARGYLEDALSRHRKRVRLTGEEWAEMIDYLAAPEGETARQP